MCDENGDGQFSYSELSNEIAAHLFPNITYDEFKEPDLNGDDKVSIEELMEWSDSVSLLRQRLRSNNQQRDYSSDGKYSNPSLNIPFQKSKLDNFSLH